MAPDASCMHEAAACLIREAFPPHILTELLSKQQHALGGHVAPSTSMEVQLAHSVVPPAVLQALADNCCAEHQQHPATASAELNLFSRDRAMDAAVDEAESTAVRPLPGGNHWKKRMDLSYESRTAEDRFCSWYSQSLSHSDVLASLIYIGLAITGYSIIASEAYASYGSVAYLHAAPLILAVLGLGLALPVCQRLAPTWTTVHRESLVLWLRVVTVVHVLLYHYLNPGFHESASPLVAAVNSSGLLPLVSPSLRLRLRFRKHVILHTALFALCAACHASWTCSAAAFGHVEGRCANRKRGMAAGGSCLWSLGIQWKLGLAVLGYLLPTVVAYILERRARADFERASERAPSTRGKRAVNTKGE